MQSIITRYYGPTNTRGPRIVATASSYKAATGETRKALRLSMSGDNHSHRHVAEDLANRLGWSGEWVEGALNDQGDSVFVHVNQGTFEATRFVVPEKGPSAL